MTTSKTLYPLKFHPIFKERIWGGQKLKTVLEKDISSSTPWGESWEISTVDNDISVVKGGSLDGSSLTALIDEFKGQLVGEKVYATFGNQFPLLIKFLDAQEDLSIQVHPDDALAQQRHNSFGKTEMWYVLQADPGSSVRSGFNRQINKEIYLKHLEEKKLDDILNVIPVKEDDVIFLPAGRVHSIGKGLVIAEIQQTSDITYRVYDFDRRDKNGNTRELHTEQALDAIDYNYYPDVKTSFQKKINTVTNTVNSNYFSTNLIYFDKLIKRAYHDLDSFVILIGIEGKVQLTYEGGSIDINRGDSVLLPASIKNVELVPYGEAKLLETFVPNT